MKMIHISDLHIGRRLNEFSLLDDQAFLLDEILKGILAEKPDVVLIAGDVYDKSTPSADAVRLLDSFLDRLSIPGLTVMLISGNHDSADRLSFGSKRMEASGLYIKGGFNGAPEPITLQDQYGPVNFYLLPFFRIADVNYCYNTDFTDYTEAFRLVYEKMNIDPTKRNVIISHQYVAGATFSESESAIGSIGYIAVESYLPFDYSALGHIHKAQNIGSDRIRYCGTPMRYSYSEINAAKGYTVVELGAKPSADRLCEINIRNIPLKPYREVREISGTLDQLLTAPLLENGIVTDDYVFIALTDEHEIINASSALRPLYPHYVNIRNINTPSGQGQNPLMGSNGGMEDPLKIFSEFYQLNHNGEDMDEESKSILIQAINQIWGDDNETN